MEQADSLQIFIDADVLFAAANAAAETSASLVLLKASQYTLLNAITSDLVIEETQRNVLKKFPKSIPALHQLVTNSITVIPTPALQRLINLKGLADPKDIPILAAAVASQCRYLVTFNIRHFQPGHPDVNVVQPGTLLKEIRKTIATL